LIVAFTNDAPRIIEAGEAAGPNLDDDRRWISSPHLGAGISLIRRCHDFLMDIAGQQQAIADSTRIPRHQREWGGAGLVFSFQEDDQYLSHNISR